MISSIFKLITNLIAEVAPSYRLDFLYDENGILYGFVKDNSAKYFYVRDCMQNILGIIDSTGNLIVKYIYTGFGKCTVSGTSATTIGVQNPFRFKGYYYDTESDMYYCQSRYYVPEWGRWLNTDSPSFLKPNSVNELNLFAYCANDPVNYIDPSGCISIRDFFAALVGVFLSVVTICAVVASGGALLAPVAVGMAIGAGANIIGQGIANVSQNKGFFEDINWRSVGIAGLAGGAFATGIGGAFGAFMIGASSSAAISAVEGDSIEDIAINGAFGGFGAFVGYGIGKQITKRLVNINTNLRVKDYLNMAKVDGAGFLKRSMVAISSKIFTSMGSIGTSITRTIIKSIGNMLKEQL